MFTGIVVELGRVHEIQNLGRGARLKVESEKVIVDAKIGDSISVNGVCLTVTEVDKTRGVLCFDLSFETLRRTNLHELKPGNPVNLEPALTLSTRLGGHLVSGHVEAVGTIKRVEHSGDYITVEIEAPKSVLKYCIEKGSIAVDGISLTIVELSPNSFTVVVVPHTAKVTTIGQKKVGDKVNLESDLIAKYVEKLLRSESSSREERLIAKLREYGFINQEEL